MIWLGIAYCLSKKSWHKLYSILLFKMSQDFLDTQYYVFVAKLLYEPVCLSRSHSQTDWRNLNHSNVLDGFLTKKYMCAVCPRSLDMAYCTYSIFTHIWKNFFFTFWRPYTHIMWNDVCTECPTSVAHLYTVICYIKMDKTYWT